MMLQMAWALRDVTDEYITLHGTPDLEKDRLTDLEWAIIAVIKDFLEKLSMSTKACESKESTVALIPPSMDYILSLFEKLKTSYKDDPTFASMFNSGWAKMHKYYELSDKTPVYIAVYSILHVNGSILRSIGRQSISGAKERMKTDKDVLGDEIQAF